MDSANTSTTTNGTGPLELFLIPTLTMDGVKTLIIDNKDSATALNFDVFNERMQNMVLIVDHFNKSETTTQGFQKTVSEGGNLYGKYRQLLAKYLADRSEGLVEDRHDPESQWMELLRETKITILTPSSERKEGDLKGWDMAKAVVADYTSDNIDEYGNVKSVVPVSGGEDSEVATQQVAGTEVQSDG